MATGNLAVWSIPPIISDAINGELEPPVPNPATGTMRIPLRQGIICRIDMNTNWLFQNLAENEDDFLEFSYHGNKEGTWNVMNSGTLVKSGHPMYFLNRTDEEVIYMALYPQ